MTMAGLLGQHGVNSMVVERHSGSAIHPRAALMLQRSMEVFRSLGVEDEMRVRSFDQFDPDGAIMAVETLTGKEIAWYMTRVNDGVRDLSPSERIFVTQIAVEPVLQARAEELGATVRFSTEATDVAQDDDGVTVTVRDRNSGETSTIRAKYLIAADGTRSPIRDRLGIDKSGHGLLGNSITIYFRAEVEELLGGRNLSVIMVLNDVLQGFFRIEKPYRSGFLVVHGIGDPQHPESDLWTGLDDDRCIEWVRAALGVPDIPVEIHNVMKWEATAATSDRFRDGRIFLVGDSAHQMPPYGGYGGNTGIQGAHNLAWKLAAVLSGAADDSLLDTYEAERKPVASFTVEQAYSRFVVRAAPFRAADGIEQTVPDANIDLGYRYRSSAVVAADDVEWAIHDDPRALHAVPGSRAPHYELTIAGTKRSTLDLYHTNFVLFTGAGAESIRAAAADAAAAIGIGLDSYVVDSGIDPDGGFLEAHGLSDTGALLVRPDGFVAWRARADADGRGVADSLRGLLGVAA